LTPLEGEKKKNLTKNLKISEFLALMKLSQTENIHEWIKNNIMLNDKNKIELLLEEVKEEDEIMNIVIDKISKENNLLNDFED
jgi:Mg2+/Co2+ transporter CorC